MSPVLRRRGAAGGMARKAERAAQHLLQPTGSQPRRRRETDPRNSGDVISCPINNLYVYCVTILSSTANSGFTCVIHLNIFCCEFQEIHDAIQYYEQILTSLSQRCDDVTPLRARSQPQTRERPITALCSYKQLNVRARMRSVRFLLHGALLCIVHPP